MVEQLWAAQTAAKMAKTAAAGKTAGIAGTAKAVAAKTLAVMAAPTFGIVSLVAIIGFEYWKGTKDAKGFAAEKAGG